MEKGEKGLNNLYGLRSKEEVLNVEAGESADESDDD